MEREQTIVSIWVNILKTNLSKLFKRNDFCFYKNEGNKWA